MQERASFEIRIRGTVQGVGFRPTVWRLARDAGLLGEVLNDGLGVLIRVTGSRAVVTEFLERLRCEPPPLSHVEGMDVQPLDRSLEFVDFRIVESAPGESRTRIAPDAATCAECQAEVFNPTERRYAYPFANCTHCGPRFSIVTGIPYDRERTTMAAFAMCEACQAEYQSPADRRFHAQPIACPSCGPTIWLEAGESLARVDRSQAAGEIERAAQSCRGNAAVQEAVAVLKQGGIVALRGLGGFHLACDATNPSSVQRLRSRKVRYAKPFALMAADLETIRRYAHVSTLETELLRSPEAPIVLLDATGPESLPAEIASGLDTVGFMLPYTPLHLMILRQMDGRPLVMTSGNVSDEPQITSLHAARRKLRGLADAALMHNREIANRIDDSVVRIMVGQPRMLRRARGYAPAALPLPAGFEDSPDLLAYGGQLKATFCLLKDGAAVVSQHQGDLDDVATLNDYQKNLQLYQALYDHRPNLLVADLHPEYLSTKLARTRSLNDDLPLLSVQHHHAHIASCLAENGVGLADGPVIGVALDGLGLGDDETLWGGELLLADYRGYRRLGTFKPVAMPGGDRAVREPWRSAYAHLAAACGWPYVNRQFSDLAISRYLVNQPLSTIDQMLRQNLNAPLASSCGRLFDAVAAAIGLTTDVASHEGQGAMELEAVAEHWSDADSAPAYPFSIATPPASDLLVLDPTQMWLALLDDLAAQTPAARVAARFHQGLANAIRAIVVRLRETHPACANVKSVALSGGCFQNKRLLESVVQLLGDDGLACLLHAKVPANDGGLSLGQAAIAAARFLNSAAPQR